tara:strand:+ start:647 stop:829 length:183 start_codon:yes stop_codon:yes gene_type:complete
MIDIDKIELRLRSGNVRPFNHLAWELIGEIKRLREENRSLFLQLSKVQGQLNAIHRGEEE